MMLDLVTLSEEEFLTSSQDFQNLFYLFRKQGLKIELPQPNQVYVHKVITMANSNNPAWLEKCFLRPHYYFDVKEYVFYGALRAFQLNKISLDNLKNIMLFYSILSDAKENNIAVNDIKIISIDSLLGKEQREKIVNPIEKENLEKIEPKNRFVIQLKLNKELSLAIKKNREYYHDKKTLPDLINDKNCGLTTIEHDESITVYFDSIQLRQARVSSPSFHSYNEFGLKPTPIFGVKRKNNYTEITPEEFEYLQGQGLRPEQFTYPGTQLPNEADTRKIFLRSFFTEHDCAYHNLSVLSFVPKDHIDFFLALSLFFKDNENYNNLQFLYHIFQDMELTLYRDEYVKDKSSFFETGKLDLCFNLSFFQVIFNIPEVKQNVDLFINAIIEFGQENPNDSFKEKALNVSRILSENKETILEKPDKKRGRVIER